MRKDNIIRYLIIYLLFSLSILNGSFLFKQIIFYIIGFSLLYFINKFNVKYIYILYVVFNLLLLYLLFFGDSINGSKCWIRILGISVQPSEFMKVILIFILSIVANRYDKYILKSFVIVLIPSVLTFLEPDTGNVIMYFIILLSIIFYKSDFRKSIKYIVGMLVLAVLFVVILLNLNLIDYRLERIESLFNNNSYQLNRALINIGNSSTFGNKDNISIPFQTTDFAFAYLITKIGVVGILVFLIFNTSFDIYLINSLKYFNGYKKYILFSFIIIKIFNESIHILMNIGLFPITGIPLPFVSYGGSSLLSYFILVSFVFNNNKVALEGMG